MKKLFGFMLLMSTCIAANANKEADIDYIELKTSDEIKTTLIAESAGKATIELTIEPTELGYTDGKGIKITDANGERLLFSLSDEGYSAILWDGTLLDATNDFLLATGEKYRFIVSVTERTVQVSQITSSGVVHLLDSVKVLTPPLDYSLFVQRTGAKFHDVIITSH